MVFWGEARCVELCDPGLSEFQSSYLAPGEPREGARRGPGASAEGAGSARLLRDRSLRSVPPGSRPR